MTAEWHSMAADCSEGTTDEEGGKRYCSLYIRKGIECEDLSLKNSQEQFKSLRVTVKEQGSKGSLVIRIYYRPPNQVEPIDGTFHYQLQEAPARIRRYNPWIMAIKLSILWNTSSWWIPWLLLPSRKMLYLSLNFFFLVALKPLSNTILLKRSFILLILPVKNPNGQSLLV